MRRRDGRVRPSHVTRTRAAPRDAGAGCLRSAGPGAGEIRESYREARVALGIARRLHRTGATSYQELRSFTVLARNRRHRITAASWYEKSWRRCDPGPTCSTPSAPTWPRAATSMRPPEVLNVHRNTMLAKLDRISRVLGMDIASRRTSSPRGWRFGWICSTRCTARSIAKPASADLRAVADRVRRTSPPGRARRRRPTPRTRPDTLRSQARRRPMPPRPRSRRT